MKRFLSCLMVLLLLVGMVPAALAAGPAVTMEVGSTSVQDGGSVTVSLSIDTAYEGLEVFTLKLYYDADRFDVASSAKGEAYAATEVSKPKTDSKGTYLNISGIDTSGQAFTLNAGKIADITFTAKAGEEAAAAQFSLAFTELYDMATGTNHVSEVTVSDPVTVTVSPVTEPAAEGYTVDMPEDTTKAVGETVTIEPVVAHTGDVATYNAFDMTFSYDPAKLTLTSKAIEGMNVVLDEAAGNVRVQGHGADRAVNTAPFALTFTVNGSDTVILKEAKVDISANAIKDDAPEAAKTDAETVIAVKYPVVLPEGFTGENYAETGKGYTFTDPGDKYIADYNVTYKVGDGEAKELTKNADGKYVIPAEDVTGPITISSTPVGIEYNVTPGTDMTGSSTANYGVDYKATLTPEAGYIYNVTVTIGGTTYTGVTVADNVYTIKGGDIKGDIVFTVTKTPIPTDSWTVTYEGDKGTLENTTVEKDAAHSFKLPKEPGYAYTVTYKMGDATEAVKLDEVDGKYTIEKVTGNVVITITKSAISDYTVSVSPYVEADNLTVFLVEVSANQLTDGYAFAYGEQNMYFKSAVTAGETTNYGTYVWLEIVKKVDTETATFTADDAKAKITVVNGAAKKTLTTAIDVNMSNLVDINDAQLVYDIYMGKYEDFTKADMERFLNADTNSDKIVNAGDATVVVNAIQ